MSQGYYIWSKAAASNGSADASINMSEGMAPSQVNDGIRALMARTAEYRDDIAGAIVTTGSSTAYAVTTNQVFDTLPHMSGAMIAFTPHVTNADTVTLNVDGLGAKPLRSAPSTEIVAGTIVQGTPYVAVYNNSDASFYLQGYFASPYNVPFLGGLDYWDTVTPNSSFIFPAGQAISRTVYSRAYARWGTTYGAGDGSTTFNVPDKTERVSVMKASSASRLTSTYFGGDSTALGATGGAESNTLTTAGLPNASLSISGTVSASIVINGNISDIPHGNITTGAVALGGAFNALVLANGSLTQGGNLTGSTTSSSISGSTSAMGSGGAHANVQPTIVCNYILRVI